VYSVKVNQYAYLLITSEALDPGLISERMGMMPDRVKLMGARDPGPPPIPRFHMWHLYSGVDDRAVPLGAHLLSLAARVKGTEECLRALVDSGEVRGVVSIVRRFEAGPIGQPSEDPTGFAKLAGQHRLLGFGVPSELLNYVIAAGITLDFDEYGEEE
jgi:hypothetical protein